VRNMSTYNRHVSTQWRTSATNELWAEIPYVKKKDRKSGKIPHSKKDAIERMSKIAELKQVTCFRENEYFQNFNSISMEI